MGMILYDIKVGILKQWRKYAFAGIFILALVIIISSRFENGIVNGKWEGTYSPIDILLYWFRGTRILYSPEQFMMTSEYVITNIYLAFIIGNYVMDDINGMGKLCLVRTRNRKTWWCGKVVWNFLTVLILYGMIVLFAVLVCGISQNGAWSACINSDIVKSAGYMIGEDRQLSGTYFFNWIIVVPFLCSVAISMIQMLVALCVSPIIGYVVVLVQMVVSVFLPIELLLGNGHMLIRSDYFISEGFNALYISILAVVIFIAACFVGLVYFKKYDVINKGRNQ